MQGPQIQQYGIGELVIRADYIPPERTRSRRNPFRLENEKVQPVVVRLSASAILWAFAKHTARIAQELDEWRNLELWRKLQSAHLNTIQISRDPNSVRVEMVTTSAATSRVRILSVQKPSESLVLDFGDDRSTALRWHNGLQLITLPWRTLVSQSSQYVVRDLQNIGLIKAITGNQQKPLASGSQSDRSSQSESTEVVQRRRDAVNGFHDELVLVHEQVQSGTELLAGVLEALEITIPVFEQICAKLPLVGAAVQLSCLGLSTISKIIATQFETRLVDEVRRRVNRIASRILLEMLQADYRAYEASEEYIQSLEGIMAGLEAAHASLDRYVIRGVLHRTWSGSIPSDIMTCLDAVESNLRNQRILHTTLNTAHDVRKSQQDVQHIQQDVQQMQQDLQHLRISITDLKDTVPCDSYAPCFQMSRRLDLGRMFVLKGASTSLSALTEAVLGQSTATRVFHVQGEGGIGKSTTCCLLVSDETVQKTFHDGSIWIQLGRTVSEDDVISELSRNTRNLGGSGIAADVEGLVGKRGGLEEAVELVSHFVSGRHLLVILDNVWLRPPHEPSWLSLLSRLVPASTAHSTIVVTSREMSVCQGVQGFSVQTLNVPRLDVTGDTTTCETAIHLFDCIFVRSVGGAPPNQTQDDYVQGRKELLKLTSGIHLLIVMVATYVAIRKDRRGEALCSASLRLADHILYLKSQGHHESPHAAAILVESLNHAEQVAADDPLGLLDNIQKGQGAGCFLRMYESLCIAPESMKAIPISVLEFMWNLSRDEADAVAEMFESTSIARIQASDMGIGRGYDLVLHDLQMRFCEESALRNGRSSTHHENLLRMFREKSGRDLPSCPSEYDWSMHCFPGATASDSERERGFYLSRQLVRHIVGASTATGDEAGRRRLLQLLTDFRWISKRGAHFGRTSLLKDFSIAAPQLFKSVTSTPGAPSNARDSGPDLRWTPSELEFIEYVKRVLLSIPPAVYKSAKNQGLGNLATALYGRIQSSKVWIMLSTSQRPNSVSGDEGLVPVAHHFSAFADNVARHTKDTWLYPLNVFYSPPQRADGRLLQEIAASDDHIRGLVSLSGGRHVVTGSGDGVIGVHDIVSGETTAVFRVHTGSVVGLHSTRKNSDMSGEEIISCSVDGTIRLWHVEDHFRPTLRPVQCLMVEHENDTVHPFLRADISDDGTIIVGVLLKESQIHLWKRSDKNGKHQYRGRLPGELGSVPLSVSISGDGSYIACSNFVAITEWKAINSDEDRNDSWRMQSFYPFSALAADEVRVVKAWIPSCSTNNASMRPDETVLWMGTRHGLKVSLHFETENARSLYSVITCMRKGVNSFSFVKEGTKWQACEILLGHNDGTITRHLPPLNGETDDSYGIASPFGSSAVWSLAIVPPRSEAGESRAFVSGHADGTLRVWRMNEGTNSSQNTNFLNSEGRNWQLMWPCGQGLPDATACIAGSLDGRLVVSGSKRGRLCLWDASRGALLVSKILPSVVSRRSGRMLYCCIQTVDICNIDGNVLIACGACDWLLRVWDVSNDVVQTTTLPQAHRSDGEYKIGVTHKGEEVGFAVTLFSSDASRIGILATDGDVIIFAVQRSEDGMISLQLVYSAHNYLSGDLFQAQRAFHGGQGFKALAISPDGKKYILLNWEGECLLLDSQNASGAVRERVDASNDRIIESCLTAFAAHDDVDSNTWRERAIPNRYIGSQLGRSVVSSGGDLLAVRCMIDSSLARRWVEVQCERDGSATTPTRQPCRVTFEVNIEDMVLIAPPVGGNAPKVVLVCGLGNGRVAFLELKMPS